MYIFVTIISAPVSYTFCGDIIINAPVNANFKIGVAAAHYTNAWNVTNTQDMVKALEAIGAEVVWNEANNDAATQIANVEDLLAQNIDLLVIKPKEEEGLIPAFEQCKEAGVPIICVDRKVRDSSLYVTAIMTDNVAGGEW